ncbi:hypothetical protein OSI85_10505, partial [Mycobacterium ulcerans]
LNTGPCAPPSAAAGAGDAGPATDPGTGCAGDEGIIGGPTGDIAAGTGGIHPGSAAPGVDCSASGTITGVTGTGCAGAGGAGSCSIGCPV